MQRILLIEDEADIALPLKTYLEEGGYRVELSGDGERGLSEAVGNPPDLILLDLNLPGMDGLEVYKQLSQGPTTADIPVIMVTARSEEGDRVLGLELGADDYIVKPFSVKELLARVRAVLRRVGPPSETLRVLVVDDLRVDEETRRVSLADEDVALTRKEFDLLAALIRGKGRVLSRERLLGRVWGYECPGETRTVDVHVRQLRRKLGAAADRIETVVGIGYRFRSGS